MKFALMIVLSALLGLAFGAWRAAAHFGLIGEANQTAMFDYPADPLDDLWEPPVNGPQPKATFDAESHDFGTAIIGEKGSHAFVVRNDGKFPLLLRKGETSCKCTVADLSEEAIPPGGSASIVVTWNAVAPVASRQNRFRQVAFVHTNDPALPIVELMVVGLLASPVRLDPAELVFPRIAGHQTVSAEVYALGLGDVPLQITGHKLVDSDAADAISVNLRPMSSEESKKMNSSSGAVIRVTIKPGLPRGPFRQTIRLTTNLERPTTIDLPIEGEILGDAIVSGPGYIRRGGVWTISPFDRHEGVERTLTIDLYGPHRRDVQAKIIDVSPPQMIASIKAVDEAPLGDVEKENSENSDADPSNDAQRVELKISVPPDAAAIDLFGPGSSDMGRLTIDYGVADIEPTTIWIRLKSR
jgi:hypothetical protein